MTTIADTIRTILTSFQAEGLFTHAHCLAGSIESPEVTTDVAVCRDSARIFDLSSLTKALCTAPLVYKALIEQKQDLATVTVKDIFDKWPPQLPDHYKSLQIRALLRHESGLPAWRNFWLGRLGVGKECVGDEGDWLARHDAALSKLSTIGLLSPLPAAPIYSDIGFILLGVAIEQLQRQSLAKQFEGILTSSYNSQIQFSACLPGDSAFVPSAFCPLRRRLLAGEVHDENCAALGGITGHAGLFGTVYGVAAVLRSLTASSLYRPFLEMNANHIIPNEPGSRPNDSLFGWRQGSDRSASGFAGGLGMGHLGFTGTAFWVDWSKKRFAILLTNRVISGRINRAIVELRSRIFASLN